MGEWMRLCKIKKTEDSGYIFDDVMQEKIWDKLSAIPARQYDCWVGMQVTDTKNIKWYVWGHRMEKRQNNRSVILFSYVFFPLSVLGKVSWCTTLTEMVWEIERDTKLNEDSYEGYFPSERRKPRPNRERLLNEVMAKSYLTLPPDELVRDRFSISGSYEDLCCDIDYIWEHTLFPERLPTIVLWTDSGVDYLKQSRELSPYWNFIVNASKDYSFPELKKSLKDELQQYLYYIGYSILKENVPDFQKFLFQDDTVETRRQFEAELPDDLPDEEKAGRKRERVFSFLIWWYAIKSNQSRFLPNKAQKEAMLKEFWPERK